MITGKKIILSCFAPLNFSVFPSLLAMLSTSSSSTFAMAHNALTQRSELTWRRPKEIIPNWKGNRKVLSRALDQEHEDDCGPIALVEGIKGKLRLQAHKNNLPPPPKLSTQQLIDVRNRIRNKKHRTLSRLLEWVRKFGIVADSDYDARNKRANPNARRYFISGWEYVDPSEDISTDKMKQLLSESPVIGEVAVFSSYDKTGKKELLYRAEGIASMDGGIQVGHAVLFTGWGYKPDDTLFWKYQNSYGVTFGRDGGFGEVVYNKFHWAYAIKEVIIEDPTSRY